jgi:hypothetical protein
LLRSCTFAFMSSLHPCEVRYTRYTVTVVDTERVMTFRAVTHCYGVAHLPSVMPSSCEEPICLMNIGRGNGRILRKSLPANGCNGVTRFFAVFGGIEMARSAMCDKNLFVNPKGIASFSPGSARFREGPPWVAAFNSATLQGLNHKDLRNRFNPGRVVISFCFHPG